MCLPIFNLDAHTLAKGEHLGLEWQITRNDMAYRCGYIRLDPGHPWFGLHYDNIRAEVHGGLTFARAGTECPTHGAADEWWIGFDCAHLGDAPDPKLPAIYRMRAFAGDTVRSTEYVIAACMDLARQAREVRPQL